MKKHGPQRGTIPRRALASPTPIPLISHELGNACRVLTSPTASAIVPDGSALRSALDQETR